MAFIALKGSSALSGLYADLGAAELAISLEAGIAALIRGNGLVITLAFVAVAVLVVRAALAARRRER